MDELIAEIKERSIDFRFPKGLSRLRKRRRIHWDVNEAIARAGLDDEDLLESYIQAAAILLKGAVDLSRKIEKSNG